MEEFGDKNVNMFTASKGWCDKFMPRNRHKLDAWTKLPNSPEEIENQELENNTENTDINFIPSEPKTKSSIHRKKYKENIDEIYENIPREIEIEYILDTNLKDKKTFSEKTTQELLPDSTILDTHEIYIQNKSKLRLKPTVGKNIGIRKKIKRKRIKKNEKTKKKPKNKELEIKEQEKIGKS